MYPCIWFKPHFWITHGSYLKARSRSCVCEMQCCRSNHACYIYLLIFLYMHITGYWLILLRHTTISLRTTMRVSSPVAHLAFVLRSGPCHLPEISFGLPFSLQVQRGWSLPWEMRSMVWRLPRVVYRRLHQFLHCVVCSNLPSQCHHYWSLF